MLGTFGLSCDDLKDEIVMAWGARAIFQNGTLDFLYDRQQVTDGNALSKARLLKWVDSRAIPLLKVWIKDNCVSPSAAIQFEHQEFKYIMRASPNQSHGYMYITCAELRVSDGGVTAPEKPRVPERGYVVRGKNYLFNADKTVAEIGDMGVALKNNRGHGVVCGYHTEKYSADGDLLCLRVKLDKPPKDLVQRWFEQARGDADERGKKLLRKDFVVPAAIVFDCDFVPDSTAVSAVA
jgi:hypothetical protein